MTLAQKIVLSVLVLVVLATSAAVLAVNLGFVAQGATQQTFAKWGSAAVLSEIVFLFLLVGKKVFNLGGRMSIQILPSPDFPTLKPGRIRWNDAKCFLKTEKVDARVRLINSSVGQTWTVHIPAKVAEKLADTDLLNLDSRTIEETNGRRARSCETSTLSPCNPSIPPRSRQRTAGNGWSDSISPIGPCSDQAQTAAIGMTGASL